MQRTLILLLIIPLISHAGIKKLTWHSRANCINNESITWHLGHSYNLRTYGHHSTPYTTWPCDMDTQYENTWRSAAVHWGEGKRPDGLYLVTGDHYMKDRKGKNIKLGTTRVTNCSIYDGWWDH